MPISSVNLDNYIALLSSRLTFSSLYQRREKAGCFALFVFLRSCDCCVALPHDVTGLPGVCDCGIF